MAQKKAGKVAASAAIARQMAVRQMALAHRQQARARVTAMSATKAGNPASRPTK